MRAVELRRAERALVDRLAPAEGELRRLLEVRIPDLFGWGGRRAAERYAEALEVVAARGDEALTVAVAVGLHKLIAYKDEYEVARLHLLGLRDLPAGAKVKFLLHPPVLRALGMDRKLRLGAWFIPAFRMLRAGRRLRGTAFDPFGRASVRRVERELPDEYLALVASAPPELAVAVAELADVVRGYEDIKLANVERFRAEASRIAPYVKSHAVERSCGRTRRVRVYAIRNHRRRQHRPGGRPPRRRGRA